MLSKILPPLLIFVAVVVSLRITLLEKGFVFKDDMAFPFETEQVREVLTNRFYVWYGKIGGGFDPTLPSSIPFWTLYNLLGMVLNPEYLNKLIIMIPFVIAGYSMYIFLRKRISALPSLLAAFLYMFNPWTFDRLMSGHLNLLLGYALTPIPLMFIFREKIDFKYAILAAFAMGLILSVSVHTFLLVFLLVALYVILQTIFSRRLCGMRRIGSIALVFVVALGLNFFWLLPLFTHYPFISSALTSSVEGSAVEILNSQATILNTIRLTGYWLPYFRVSIGELGSFSVVWSIFSFIIPILSFVVLSLKKDKMTAFFSIGAIVFLVPSMIVSSSSNVYLQLVDYFSPLALFRDSYKFVAIVCLCYSVLIGILLEKLLSIRLQLKISIAGQNRLRKHAKVSLVYFAVGLVVISPLIYATPNVLSGDYMGQLTAQAPPSYWFDVKNFLSEKGESQWRALWAPPFTELHYEWHNANSIDPVDEYLTSLYSVSQKSRSPPLESYLDLLISSMYEKHFDTNIAKVLSPLSVRYIVVRLDAAPKWKEQQYPTSGLQEVFEHQLGLSKVFESGKWIVYENVHANPYVAVPALNVMLVLGNLSAITNLSHLSEGDLPPMFFMDLDKLSPYDVDKLVALSNTLANVTTLTLAIPMDQSVAKSNLLGQIKGKVRMMYFVEGERLRYEQKSIVPNYSFGEGLSHWSLNSSAFSMKLSGDTIHGQNSLEVTTNSNVSDSWSWISSDVVPLVPGTVYKLGANIKISNVAKSQIEIMGFNKLNESWEDICWLPSDVDGTQNWTNYELLWQNSQNLTQIRVVLNAGWVNDPSMGNATTFFDGINIAPLISYDNSFSNGSALPLYGMAKTEVELLSPSIYKIGLRLLSTEENEVKVRLYNNKVEQITEIPVEPDSLNLFYSQPVYLPSGNFTIEISSEKPSIVDTMVVISVEKEDETLQDLFVSKEAPARVISFRRVNPTSYVAYVNSTGPFLLSLSEAYDPSWIAYVGGQRIEPTPLYSAINGFWINQTGQLDITIAYEEQKWFYYGSASSIAILSGCVTILAYDCVKNEDIRKKLKKTFRRWFIRRV